MTVSIEDQIKCVARELALRRNVYKGFVARGKMTQITADKEIEAMTAVIETLKALRPAPVDHAKDLFPG